MFSEKKKQFNKTKGHSAEEQAKEYMLSLGFKLLEENWQNRYGELDLIVRKKDLIVFVEVRFRSSLEWGSPEESVNARKQRQVVKTAIAYLHKKAWLEDKDIRFDVIAITPQEGLKHYPEAFDASVYER